MRALLVALVCSGAILGQAAIAQTDSSAAPSPSAQSAATATTAPSQAATAAAATAPATVSQDSANSNVNLDEIVCKQQPPATGSRLGGGRECHTVREWNQREKEAQDITRQEERTGYSRPGG
ncbi:MAG TPA: hypothetical protein VKR31_17810 [Rhizomicrobium sp.]|nr:hypothetical protein [Rhizomicrobium sp.]